MRISQLAMNAGLENLHRLKWSTKLVSLYESFLVAKWLEAKWLDKPNHYPRPPTIDHVNQAVADLFVFEPEHVNGRLSAFRYGWRQTESSGRKTVWNNTTRYKKVATSIFQGDNLKKGLRPNASDTVRKHLKDRELPSVQALICLVLRNYEFPQKALWHDAESELKKSLNISSTDLSKITNNQVSVPRCFQIPNGRWQTYRIIWPRQRSCRCLRHHPGAMMTMSLSLMRALNACSKER